MTEQDVVRAITKDTRITLWLAVVCAVALLTVYIKADARLRLMEEKILNLRYEVQNLTKMFEASAGDRWTQTEMYYWHLILKEKNPEIEVPTINLGSSP